MALRRSFAGFVPASIALAALSLAGCAHREANSEARYGSIKDSVDHARPASTKIASTSARPITKTALKADDMRLPPVAKVDMAPEPIKSPLATTPRPPAVEAPSAPRTVEVPAAPKLPPAPPPVNARPPQPKSDVASSSLLPSSPSALGASGEKKAPLSALDAGNPNAQIEQAELLLRIGNIKGAREALAAGVKNKHADSIAALGRTFDPIELEKFLVPAGTTDAAKAATLYEEAAALGSTVAKTRLEKLKGALVLPAQKK